MHSVVSSGYGQFFSTHFLASLMEDHTSAGTLIRVSIQAGRVVPFSAGMSFCYCSSIPNERVSYFYNPFDFFIRGQPDPCTTYMTCKLPHFSKPFFPAFYTRPVEPCHTFTRILGVPVHRRLHTCGGLPNRFWYCLYTFPITRNRQPHRVQVHQYLFARSIQTSSFFFL
jgi:hypothetical protein